MIICSILELDLPDNQTVKATDWQVSDKKDFSNIVCQSLNDTENLLNIVFTDNIEDAGVTLYGRARVLTEAGWSAYNNLDIIQTSTEDDSYNLPVRISPPRLFTTIYGNLELRKENNDISYLDHPLTMFYITNNKSYAVIGDSQHIATTWYIEDIDGNVVWKSIRDSINLDTILVDNIILEENKIYVARCILHSDTNDNSDVSSYRFSTTSIKNKALYTWLNNTMNNLPDGYSEGFSITFPIDADLGSKATRYTKLYQNKDGRLTLVTEINLTDNNRTLTYRAGQIVKDKLYTIFFKTKDTDQYDLITFSTYGQNNDTKEAVIIKPTITVPNGNKYNPLLDIRYDFKNATDETSALRPTMIKGYNNAGLLVKANNPTLTLIRDKGLKVEESIQGNLLPQLYHKVSINNIPNKDYINYMEYIFRVSADSTKRVYTPMFGVFTSLFNVNELGYNTRKPYNKFIISTKDEPRDGTMSNFSSVLDTGYQYNFDLPHAEHYALPMDNLWIRAVHDDKSIRFYAANKQDALGIDLDNERNWERVSTIDITTGQFKNLAVPVMAEDFYVAFPYSGNSTGYWVIKDLIIRGYENDPES